MDIQDLRIFNRVAAVQNLSAVGSEFSLTPGTISKRLQALEDELGVQLFLRSTRSIRITEEGRIFLDHAQRMLAEFDAAKASVDVNCSKPRGLIRMSAPAYLGGHDISHVLGQFLALYPDINVQAEICDRSNGIAEDGFDITIRCGSLPDSSLIAKRLCDEPMSLVASPQYVELRGALQAPADLDKHPCLVHGDACQWPFRRKSYEKTVRLTPRLRSNDASLLRALAIDGHGIARLPTALVAGDVREGKLVPLLADLDCSGDAAVWAIFPKSKHMLPRLRVLIDFLSEWLKEPGSQKALDGKEAVPVMLSPKLRNGAAEPASP